MTQILDQIPIFASGPNPQGATQMLFYVGIVGHAHTVADDAFAAPTFRFFVDPSGRDTFYEDQVEEPSRTEPTLLQDPEIEIDRADFPALAAIEDLRRWLGVSYEEVAEIAGLGGASTIFYWKRRFRRGHELRPRLSTVERLYRVHAVLRALSETMEGEEGVQAVQLWVRRPAPDGMTPLELLRRDRVEDVHKMARPLLFDTSPRHPPASQTLVIEDEVDTDAETPRASRRRLISADFA